MSTTGNRPHWWQRLIPRYGNWGGVGWSGGVWCNDPALTDWDVDPIDDMDTVFMWHDEAYQTGKALDIADAVLVAALRALRVTGIRARLYRIGAMFVFTVWPVVRRIWRKITMRRTFLTLLMVLAVAFIYATLRVAWGGEVPPITVADFTAPESPPAHWLWSALASDTASNIFLWLFSTGIATVVGWLKWNDSRKEAAIMFLTMGVRETYEEYVRQIKLARADGKLTNDERREAVHLAIQYGMDYAKNAGLDILKVLAKDTLPVWVDRIVRQIKGEAAISKNPLPVSQPPYPDLVPSLSSAH